MSKLAKKDLEAIFNLLDINSQKTIDIVVSDLIKKKTVDIMERSRWHALILKMLIEYRLKREIGCHAKDTMLNLNIKYKGVK